METFAGVLCKFIIRYRFPCRSRLVMFPMKNLVVVLLCAVLTSSCSVMSDIELASESQSHFKDAFYEGAEIAVSENDDHLPEYRIFHQASSGFTPQDIRNIM